MLKRYSNCEINEYVDAVVTACTLVGGYQRLKRLVSSLDHTSLHPTITNSNSVALVREQTIPTERPPLVGEVNYS
jgi:hypothetical protein